MKRELIQNVKVQPYTSGDAVERTLFLSCVVGAVIETAGEFTLTITHCDTADGTFEAVKDKKVFIEKQAEDGAVTVPELAEGDVVNIDIDLAGLKNYVKITASGTAAANTPLAIALGDHNTQPV
ncbi:hypothetical protein [uncultured Bacteroides sp.]|uniref:hypothetical protein n=1 Tax=uncultured Bacteroides sp. TaxID=162156 RepID=UPI002591C610|nr:hypothetical protein [uncultured Bacteroides sp.]